MLQTGSRQRCPQGADAPTEHLGPADLRVLPDAGGLDLFLAAIAGFALGHLPPVNWATLFRLKKLARLDPLRSVGPVGSVGSLRHSPQLWPGWTARLCWDRSTSSPEETLRT